ncbi:hypothetical protein PP182_18680 [Maribacter sp. PR1]|uniref:Uncharacterized protein n=1 Tax=Maribacter cobaltidurans TaxID=1178778 RepID=A0ABU7IYR2_9FLAO|nr:MULTISPECIES: hypothetical protein [Maribacter]MDC6390719.1 hypothetical protein [Maribacter sp. PR1]MEE1978111.1 hypothetical protein [Maribacter cobaltidurans]
MDKSKFYMVDYLVAAIEGQLGWGDGKNWNNGDFEELSERIFAETKKRLSVTTLKRIWGRAERVANPSSSTLNILSEFVGYDNWRMFVQAQESLESTEAPQIEPKTPFPWKIPLALGFVLLIALLLAFYASDTEQPSMPKKRLEKTDFQFSRRTVSEGLPNSVVFAYDATAAPDGATIEIQQSWDNNKRMTVSATDSIATSIYYRPGFFKSKLVVGDTVVREADVFIPTQGWSGMVENDSMPIYLETREIQKDDYLAITPETVAKYGLDPRTTEVVTSLYHVADYGELYTDDFQLSLQLQNTFPQGRTGCQWVRMFVLYDGGAIGIPLAKKGCAAQLDLMLFGDYISGKTTDLSSLGVDFTEAATLQCNSKDGILEILVNGQTAYTAKVPIAANKLVGVVVHFEGTGLMKEVSLSNSHGLHQVLQ